MRGFAGGQSWTRTDMSISRFGYGVALSSALMAGSALADQCAWVEQPVVEKLKALEAGGYGGAKLLIQFCAPCGDTFVTLMPLDPSVKFAFNPEGNGYTSVSYGNADLDLAYVYLSNKPMPPVTSAASLAVAAGCPVTEDTPRSISVAGDGKVTVDK
jgi:hypothetical protein